MLQMLWPQNRPRMAMSTASGFSIWTEVTAEASKESRFLGISTARVSDQQKQGWDELATALGVSTAS